MDREAARAGVPLTLKALPFSPALQFQAFNRLGAMMHLHATFTSLVKWRAKKFLALGFVYAMPFS
jgi:hypothetical protein